MFTNYHTVKQMVLSCDASHHSVGAMSSHFYDCGLETAVTFASCKLNSCEHHSSHVDKKGLSVVFGICKLPNYFE